jgi:AcrR family transcriptional regulator
MSSIATELVSATDGPAVEDAHRRGRILAALALCTAQKGYRATTISDIARTARVSKTVVYAHFRDKEHCLLELYERATDRVLRIVAEHLQRTRADGLGWQERLRAGMRVYFGALAAGPAVAWAALVEVQAAGRPALQLRRAMIDRYVDLLCALAGEFAQRHPGEVRPVGRELIVGAVGGIHELMLARIEDGDAEGLAADADTATALLVALLERRS